MSITVLNVRNLYRFASTNVVFGVGSFTYQYNTRDTFGFAMKATQVTINDEDVDIFKDPATDKGNVKKSLKGRVGVYRSRVDGELFVMDGISEEDENDSELRNVYVDGTLPRLFTWRDVIANRDKVFPKR